MIITNRLILKHYSGSIAYGLDEKGSDEDIRGVFIPTERFFLGLGKIESFKEPDSDTIYYAIQHFFKLAMQGNPNIIESLYIKPEHYLPVQPGFESIGKKLISHRHLFLSKLMIRPYIGYSGHQMSLVLKRETGGAKQKYIDAYGYDTKAAMHLMRLLHTCREALSTGTISVYRPEREYLLSIKHGEYTLDQLEEQRVSVIDEIHKLEQTTDLPDTPPFDTLEKLLIKLVKEAI